MAAITLLAAPVILPPARYANGSPASLVPAGRMAASTGAITRSDTAYPDDRYIWSATAGGDGTFHFYALPLSTSRNGGASQDSSASTYTRWPGGLAPDTLNAIAQYQLQTMMPAPLYGQLVNYYA